MAYKRHRYYDPSTGRFTQVDPIGLAGGTNVYGFATADPVNYGDPFGLCPCSAPGLMTIVTTKAARQAAVRTALANGEDEARDLFVTTVVLGSFGQIAELGIGLGASTGSGGVRTATATADLWKASDLAAEAEAAGYVRSQTANGPVKYTDENGVVRLTLKRGSDRTPGSATPHAEFRNRADDRVDQYGSPTQKRSKANHTPIDYDLPDNRPH